MNIILLSGGSGKRLWPLSNDIRSKQFLKLFKHAGGYESMVQRVYRQLKESMPSVKVTIATSRSQVDSIKNQLEDNVSISIEPSRRDTFPAIALAVAYLHEVKKVDANDPVVICPVDPYVETGYFECIKEIYDRVQKGAKDLVLMGIKPTYPSEKYGYIKPLAGKGGECAYSFTEKPTADKAAEYIAEGALWNGGVFGFKLSYVLEKSRELLGTDVYEELFEGYDELEKISFDYAVVEKEISIEVVKYEGAWKDLGTWNTLTETMQERAVGDVRFDDKCTNVHAVNELDVPVLIMGLKDAVVTASSEGILVSDLGQSSYIKPFVEAIDSPVRYAEKSWGSFRIMDIEETGMTVKVTLNPGHHMNYHSHERRDEVWTVISGSGTAILDDKKIEVKVGDVLTMPAGCKHTIFAGDDGLKLIEVQVGTDISVNDKIKYEM